MGDAGTPTLLMTGLGPSGLPSSNPTKSFWQTSHPNPITHHRSTASLPSRASVVVIGTGISGTFATQDLLLNSHVNDVLVLEARTTCSAATGRNGGHLQPLIHSERSGIIDFEMRNYRAIKALIQQYGVECDFRDVPGCLGFWNRTYFEEAKAALALYRDDEDENEDGEGVMGDEDEHVHDDKHAETTASMHASSKHKHKHKQNSLVRVIEDPEDLKALGLTGGVVGALVQNVAASLSPYKLIIAMWTRMLERFGSPRLNLQTETPVTAILRAGATAEPEGDQDGSGSSGGEGWIVRTHRGGVHAGQVILATNGYTSHLIPQLANCIVPVQAQMAALVPPKDSPFRKTLIPRSYGFMGVGSQDRVMSDYLVQNPIYREDHEDREAAVVGGGVGGRRRRGGHLMFGGGRSEVRGHGVGVSDDDYVDEDAEIYLRGLGARLRLDQREQDERERQIQVGRETGAETERQRQTDVQTQTRTQTQTHTQTDTKTETNTKAETQTETKPKLLDIAASWTGIIGHSTDGHPWVGGVPGSEGLFVCAGYTGHGMDECRIMWTTRREVSRGELAEA